MMQKDRSGIATLLILVIVVIVVVGAGAAAYVVLSSNSDDEKDNGGNNGGNNGTANYFKKGTMFKYEVSMFGMTGTSTMLVTDETATTYTIKTTVLVPGLADQVTTQTVPKSSTGSVFDIPDADVKKTTATIQTSCGEGRKTMDKYEYTTIESGVAAKAVAYVDSRGVLYQMEISGSSEGITVEFIFKLKEYHLA